MPKIQLTPENVMSVYTGRANRCCCGCSGVHSYSEQHRAAASKNRGYPVKDDEIDDETVRRVIRHINRSKNAVDEGGHIIVASKTRWHIAYLKPSKL